MGQHGKIRIPADQQIGPTRDGERQKDRVIAVPARDRQLWRRVRQSDNFGEGQIIAQKLLPLLWAQPELWIRENAEQFGGCFPADQGDHRALGPDLTQPTETPPEDKG